MDLFLKNVKNNFVEEAISEKERENLWRLWRLGRLLKINKVHVFGFFLVLFLVIMNRCLLISTGAVSWCKMNLWKGGRRYRRYMRQNFKRTCHPY